jgi:hypothetical protein
MFKTWLYILLLIVLTVGEGKSDTSTLLGSDKRLNKVTPLKLRDRPLPDILGSVSKATGVPLFADDEVKTLQASFLVKDQTAGTSLQVLADCLRLSWKKEQNGYRLYRLPEVTQQDQNRAMADAAAYARVMAYLEKEHRELTDFVAQVLARSHVTDDEVRQLAARYPRLAEAFERAPWQVVAVRVASWLTPEQWEKAMGEGIELDYKEWTLTGPDPDIPVPESSPGLPPFYKAKGRSGIHRISVRIERDGTLVVGVEHRSEDGYLKSVNVCRFGSLPLR